MDDIGLFLLQNVMSYIILINVDVTFQVQINAHTLIAIMSLNVHVDTYIINVRKQFQE